VILIDEPELGLHPSAICTIASLIHDASYNAQVIIATQSPTLLDYFEPENVIVVDWEKDGSHFTRQSPASLEDWLKDYSLSELWEKNVIGGGPF
jgi:predicted ATPase